MQAADKATVVGYTGYVCTCEIQAENEEETKPLLHPSLPCNGPQSSSTSEQVHGISGSAVLMIDEWCSAYIWCMVSLTPARDHPINGSTVYTTIPSHSL